MVQAIGLQDLEAAFREMGELLLRARTVAEIAVYGGASIILQFQAEFRTGDVDAVVEAGDHGAVMRAAEEVGRRRGWLRSWFSEAVSVYLGAPAGRSLHGSYPSEERCGLRVYVAAPDYLLAMKLRAMRTGTRDYEDAAILARHTGLTSEAALVALLSRFFPKEPPDARTLAVIGQFAASLDAPPADQPR
jgi:hypothetical protein